MPGRRFSFCLPLLALLLAPSAPAQAPAVWPAGLVTASAHVMTLLTPDEVLELMEGGQLQEAEAAARQAAAAHPESARAQVVLARILARQERLDEARRVLEQAQALPQWEEQDISVPFESPKAIDKVMQRDPQKALGLIADVLLAEGDDPKAYYLQSLAYVQLANYDASQLALNRAKEYGDVTAFAHPDTLARLEQLLRERPGTTPPIDGPGLQREPIKPWVLLLWAVGGLGAGAVAWVLRDAWRETEVERKTELAAFKQQATQQLEKEIAAIKEALAEQPTPKLQSKLDGLYELQHYLEEETQSFLADKDIIQPEFTRRLAELDTRRSREKYEGAEDPTLLTHAMADARRSENSNRGQSRHQHSEPPSSFRDDDDNSWSSGSSSSSGGNNGGSSW